MEYSEDSFERPLFVSIGCSFCESLVYFAMSFHNSGSIPGVVISLGLQGYIIRYFLSMFSF